MLEERVVKKVYPIKPNILQPQFSLIYIVAKPTNKAFVGDGAHSVSYPYFFAINQPISRNFA